MTQVYSDPSRETDPHALPDIEVFYNHSNLGDAGWFWWACFPGYLPDGDAIGPFKTEAEATANAQSSG